MCRWALAAAAGRDVSILAGCKPFAPCQVLVLVDCLLPPALWTLPSARGALGGTPGPACSARPRPHPAPTHPRTHPPLLPPLLWSQDLLAALVPRGSPRFDGYEGAMEAVAKLVAEEQAAAAQNGGPAGQQGSPPASCSPSTALCTRCLAPAPRASSAPASAGQPAPPGACMPGP
jgi:hypothetical protein